MAHFKGLDLMVACKVVAFSLLQLCSRGCMLKQKFPVNVVLFAGRSVFDSGIPLPSVL